jgi:hypothetical protein
MMTKECSTIRLKHGTDPDEKFDPIQLAMGIKVEMEHTECPKVAKQISKAHLGENPRYYTILKKVGL